jgi:3-methylcrotonyl-CoA carboxylase alpha subunit
MEMNTRLQVEHPVTEEITGQDLVEWQLLVASGEPLPLKQEELAINGWAMEARLYAEDPSTGFLPSIGRLDRLMLGAGWDFHEDGGRVRIETGVEQGDTISPFYDPMIAKLVVRGSTRDAAVDLLDMTCAQVQVWPVRTNANFLARLLREPVFRDGDVETGFIAANADRLTAAPDLSPDLDYKIRLWLADRFPDVAGPTGFRLNAPPELGRWAFVDGARRRFDADDGLAALMALAPGGAQNALAGQFETLGIHRDGKDAVIFSDGAAHHVTLAVRSSAAGAAGDGAIVSPMPGKIIALEVAAGDAVTKGQKLLTLEAMKMEHSLTAPFDGKVAELNAAAGAQVSEGALLVRIEKAGE